ncbi:beta strand repeat-containing protein [Aureimonas psammosilenae]|uniref:beta strand repeat-containing protein n=1 Tax=Aureimonas psammosilenae TaxID=2495496 RepID=UPI00126085FB|nr:calcium-binding protein [Aureimonas psammosilenae]
MATFTFDGSGSQTIDAFDPTVDTLTISVAPSQIADVREDNGNTTITTASGAVLTLTSIAYSQLVANPTSVETANGSDFTFANGTANGTALGDVLVGSTSADTLNAAGGDNLVFGGGSLSASVDGGDTITTGNGNDTIYGNGGNDTINAGSGNDLVYGGIGTDNITVSAQAGQTVTVYGGGSANDTVDGADTIVVSTSAGSALVYGNADNDSITVGSNGNNSIYGGLGNDTVNVTSNGANMIVGGVNDADSITVTGNGTNTVYGGSGVNAQDDGNDTIAISGSGSNLVYGNGGNDGVTITGDGANTVYGGFGDDNVSITGDGANLVVGGLGDADTITIAGDGNNTVYGGSAVDTTNDGNDLISVNGAGSNLIYANGGDDRVTVLGGGDNSVYGGLGNDSIFVGATGLGNAATGDNLLVGGTGTNNFTIFSEGNTTVYGGEGETDAADLVTTITATLSGGESSFFTNAGNDVVTAGLSNDASLTLNAGTGDDTATITGTADTSAILTGNAGADTFTYTGSGDVTVYGGNGVEDAANDVDAINVTLNAAGGSAAIYGNGGADNLDLSLVASTSASVFGGLGNDDIDVTGAAGSVTVFGGTGEDDINLSTFGGSSTIYGGNGFEDATDTADNIVGGTGADLIYGNAGDDVINGGAGADTIYGGVGNDAITAGTGADVVYTGTGMDTVNFGGGADADTLIIDGVGDKIINGYVEANDTTFVIGASSAQDYDVTVSGTNVSFGRENPDRVITFNGSENDRIDLNFGTSTGNTSSILTYGSNNADNIVGGAGNDHLYGNAGSDIIDGGAGNDIIQGGANGTFSAGSPATPEVQSTTFGIADAAANGNLVLNVLGTNVTVAFLSGATADSIGTSAASSINSALNTDPANPVLNATYNTTTNQLEITYNVNQGNVAQFTATESDLGFDAGTPSTSTPFAAAVPATSGGDLMTGGAGNDTFVFNVGDSGTTVTTADRITDLNLNAADKVDFDGFTASPTIVTASTGVVAADAAAANTAIANALTANADGTAQLITFSGGAFTGTYLVLDGTAGNDVVINVTGVTGTLDAADFTV